MRFIKQHNKLMIKNLDFVTNKKNFKTQRHGPLLPNSLRALIVGPSNSGKTNVMISLLENPNGLKFKNIYLYSKSLQQPKYKYLEQLLQPIKGMGFFSFSENDTVIPPEKAKPNSIMIFDDVACEKQNNVRAYFCMGRHNDIDSFYLGQTYTRIPKHLVRDNANLLVIFKQDLVNLKHIYNDHVGCDMPFTKFSEICAECWSDNYGFMVISKDDSIERGRYRKGFDVFIKY